MKKTTRKLSLNAVSIRPLEPNVLVKVAGAWTATITCTNIYACPSAQCGTVGTFQTCNICHTVNHDSCPSCPC